MVLLAQLVVEYAADLANLERGTQRALDLMQRVGDAAKGPDRLAQGFMHATNAATSFSSGAAQASASAAQLAQAQARAAVAADRVAVAQAQSAVAAKKVADMQAAGKASAEKIAVAQAQAAVAADRVKVAESNAAAAMEKVESVGRGLATTIQTDATQVNHLSETFTHLQQVASSVHVHVGNLGSSILDFGNKLGGTIFAVQNLVQGAMNLGQALLMPNASMEQLEVGFTTLLGSSQKAKDYLAQLADFAAKTPFEMPQVSDSAEKLIAMGTAAQDVIPTLTDIGDAMSGLGKGADAVNSVVLVFGQMRAAGRVTAQDMMQLTDQGIPAWKYLADAMHKTIPEVQDLASKGLIPATKGIEMLRAGMHKTFGGDMAAQSQTFIGLLSTLKDNVMAAWRSFSGPLFDQAKGALTWLGNMVSSAAFQKFAKDLGEQVGGAFKNIGKFIDDNRKGFEHFIELGGQMLKIVNNKGLRDFVLSLQQLGDTVNKIFLQPIVGWLQSMFTDKNMLDGANNLGGVFHNLSKVIDDVNGALKEGKQAWDQVQPILATIAGFINSEFMKQWQGLVDEFHNNVQPAWNDMNKAMHDSLPFLHDLSGTQLPSLATALTQLGMGIMMFGIGIAQGLLGLIEVIEGFVGTTIAGFTLVYDIVTGHFDKIPQDMDNMKNNMLNIGKGLQEGMIGQFNMMFGGISGSIDQLTNHTTDKMQKMSDELVGHSIIPDMCNSIVDWFVGLGPRVSSAVQGMISGATSQLNSFASNIGGMIHNGAASLGITIPGFANGVENFSGGLAMVHRGEVLTNLLPGTSVIPARNVSATPLRARQSQSSEPRRITIIQEVDGRAQAEYTLDYMDQRVKHKYGNRSR